MVNANVDEGGGTDILAESGACLCRLPSRDTGQHLAGTNTRFTDFARARQDGEGLSSNGNNSLERGLIMFLHAPP